MTRSGDEMMLELHNLLNKQGLFSTASKKEDDKDDEEEDKKGKEDKDKKDKDDKNEKEKDKKEEGDKKKATIMTVLNELTKLASELDKAGADDASSAVDEAMRAIVKNIESEQSSQSE